MLRNIFCWKGFGPVTGSPSFPGANFQQMVIARLSLGLSFLGLRNFLKLCHDEKPCTWWLGEKGLGSLQSRLARMLHHEYDALKGYRFLGGAISFYSVSCMSDVIFNPSLLNWSSLILTVAHIEFKKNTETPCINVKALRKCMRFIHAFMQGWSMTASSNDILNNPGSNHPYIVDYT